MAIDIFSIKPHVVTSDMAGKTFFIYGGFKTGKTTNACKFPRPLLMAFEKGFNMLPGVMAQPINSWGDALDVKRQLLKNMRDFEKGKIDEPVFQTVVVDTADIAWQQCCDYVAEAQGKESVEAIKWGKGISRAAQLYEMYFQDIARAGYAIVFISHSVRKKDKNTATEALKTMPSLPERPSLILQGMVDITACAETIQMEDGSTQLMLKMREDDSTQAGSRNPYTSDMIPFSYEALMQDMKQATEKLCQSSGQEISNEPNNPYTETFDESFKDVMAQIKSLAKTYREGGYPEKYQQIVASHLGEDKLVKDCTEAQLDVLRIIRNDLQEKTAELGLLPAA